MEPIMGVTRFQAGSATYDDGTSTGPAFVMRFDGYVNGEQAAYQVALAPQEVTEFLRVATDSAHECFPDHVAKAGSARGT